jgi:hypothetical protein
MITDVRPRRAGALTATGDSNVPGRHRRRPKVEPCFRLIRAVHVAGVDVGAQRRMLWQRLAVLIFGWSGFANGTQDREL